MIATEFLTARPAVPGLRFRHFAGPRDYPGMAGANMAARRAVGVDEAVTVDTLANQYAHLTNSDRDRDLVIVELDGRIVGYGHVEWADLNAGGRTYDQTCVIHPAVRGRGHGAAGRRRSDLRQRVGAVVAVRGALRVLGPAVRADHATLLEAVVPMWRVTRPPPSRSRPARLGSPRSGCGTPPA